jgi:lipopolysaccharide export system protein LptA
MICKGRISAVSMVALAITIGSAEVEAQQPKNQGPANALQGFSQNRNQPVKIDAATLEVREKEQKAIFGGGVHVLQGDTEMCSKSLVVYYEAEAGKPGLKAEKPGPAGQQQIRRIEATGGVIVTQKEQQAHGDTGIFDMRANTVMLVGNVVATRGQSVLRGDRLVVDLTNGVSKVEGQSGVQALIPTDRRPDGTPQQTGPAPQVRPCRPG